MKNFRRFLLIFTCVASVCQFAAAQSDLPAGAVPGKCYAKCMMPDEYTTTTEQILIKDESKKLDVVPAVYTTQEETVTVKEGYKVLEIVPASFSTVTEQIKVKDEGTKLEYVPPVFETVTEQVLVQPASTKWVKGRADANCLSANPDDCKVWCLTEIPAQYKTVTKQQVKVPASTREVPIPAEFKTITKAVVSNAANVRERDVPSESRTVTKQVLQSPATTREVTIPAEYSTITSKKLVRSGGFTDWVEVLCESKMTSAKAIEIQNALKARGYDPGPIDNVMGTRTREALVKFQKDNGLPQGNVNVETLRALGISGN